MRPPAFLLDALVTVVEKIAGPAKWTRSRMLYSPLLSDEPPTAAQQRRAEKRLHERGLTDLGER